MQETKRYGLTPVRRYYSSEAIPVLDLRTKERKQEQAKQARLNHYKSQRLELWKLCALTGLFAIVGSATNGRGQNDGGD